jgi:hypothetical protein
MNDTVNEIMEETKEDQEVEVDTVNRQEPTESEKEHDIDLWSYDPAER